MKMMDTLAIESKLGKQMMAHDDTIVDSMLEYSLAKACMQLVEIIRDVWDEVGFDKNSVEFASADSRILTCADEQLWPLEEADFADLIGQINEYVASIKLDSYIDLDIKVLPSDRLQLTLSVRGGEATIRAFYRYWKDLEARGVKELGI